MYYKGGNLLNMLREILQDDEKWRQILRGLNETFYHQTVTTAQVESYISKAFGMDLKPIFDQYLRDNRVPLFEYYYSDDQTLSYRWTSCLPSFTMPIDIEIGGKKSRITPTENWNQLKVDKKGSLSVDLDYYVKSLIIK